MMKEKLIKAKKQIKILFLIVVIIVAFIGFVSPLFFQVPYPVQLVDSTWCSIAFLRVRWQFERGKFTQQTAIFDMDHTEMGRWGITYSEDGERVLRIIWNEATEHEIQKQFFQVKILGTKFLTARGEFEGYGKAAIMFFYRCS